MDSTHSTNRHQTSAKMTGMTPRLGSGRGATGTIAPTLRKKRAAVRLTGCVSKLSSVTPLDHAYCEALKSYAEVYASYQSYLAVDDLLAAHDYTLAFEQIAEQNQLGLVGDDGEPIAHTDISEDEIDRCGYMAWLLH